MDEPPVRTSKDGVIVDLQVIPSAREDSIRLVDGVLKVKTTEPADKGKANKAVLKALKPLFGAAEIISGHTSRRKTIIVRNMVLDDVKAVLKGLAGGGVG